MNYKEAIEIINKERISNPFTMGYSLDEFVDDFRKRYCIIFGEFLPKDYIEIATKMQNLEN